MYKASQVFMWSADLIMLWAAVTKQYEQQKYMEPWLLSMGLCQSKCTVPDVQKPPSGQQGQVSSLLVWQIDRNSFLNYKLTKQQEN